MDEKRLMFAPCKKTLHGSDCLQRIRRRKMNFGLQLSKPNETYELRGARIRS
jgi:hypothetical protein